MPLPEPRVGDVETSVSDLCLRPSNQNSLAGRVSSVLFEPHSIKQAEVERLAHLSLVFSYLIEPDVEYPACRQRVEILAIL